MRHFAALQPAYAKAGFGEYLGFFSAFGYWASACVGNVTYWVLIMSTFGAVVPALGDGDTFLALLLSTAGIWRFALLILRGVREATTINKIVTVAKVIPILVFILVALFAIDWDTFVDNMTGGPELGGLFGQVRGTMLATVFVFLGVEGASVYSRYARRRDAADHVKVTVDDEGRDDHDRLVLTGPGGVRLAFRSYDAADLLVGEWKITGVATGDAVASVVAGTEPTIAFGDNGDLRVVTGCNDGSGSWELDGHDLSIGTLAHTMKACSDPEGVME